MVEEAVMVEVVMVVMVEEATAEVEVMVEEATAEAMEVSI